MQRVGLIGYGHWGPNYARIVADFPESELAMICDISPRRRKRARLDHPATAVAGAVDEALAVDLDAVVVASPAETHAAIALAALRAGRHALVEKPLGMTRVEVEAMIAGAVAADRVLMIDHTYLFSDAVAELQRLVDTGALGAGYSYRSIRTNPGRVPGPVGLLRDLAVHDLAILDQLQPHPPTVVSATPSSPGLAKVDADLVELCLTYIDGATASITVGWGTEDRERLVVLESDQATVVYDDLAHGAEVRVYSGVGRRSAPLTPEPTHEHADAGSTSSPADREPLRRVVTHFIDVVQRGCSPRTDGASALRLARILDAAHASLADGGEEIFMGELEAQG